MAEMSKPGYLSASTAAGPERILGYIEEFTHKYESNDKEVNTLLFGLDGFSDGAEKCTLDFKSAIPITGRELDFAAVCYGHGTLDLVTTLAGVKCRLRGRMMNVAEATSVNNPNALQGSFTGKIIARGPGV